MHFRLFDIAFAVFSLSSHEDNISAVLERSRSDRNIGAAGITVGGVENRLLRIVSKELIQFGFGYCWCGLWCRLRSRLLGLDSRLFSDRRRSCRSNFFGSSHLRFTFGNSSCSASSSFSFCLGFGLSLLLHLSIFLGRYKLTAGLESGIDSAVLIKRAAGIGAEHSFRFTFAIRNRKPVAGYTFDLANEFAVAIYENIVSANTVEDVVEVPISMGIAIRHTIVKIILTADVVANCIPRSRVSIRLCNIVSVLLRSPLVRIEIIDCVEDSIINGASNNIVNNSAGRRHEAADNRTASGCFQSLVKTHLAFFGVLDHFADDVAAFLNQA